MKISYLLTTADSRAGTERTIIDQANALSLRGHTTEIVSVYVGEQPGFERGPRVGRVNISELSGPIGPDSLVIPTRWDNQFCAAVDMPLLQHFEASDADIIVTTTPALTTYALLASPLSARIVQQEHRASMARGVTVEPLLMHSNQVDALVSLTHRNAEWLREQLGDRAPVIEVIGNALPDVVRPQSSRKQRVVMGAGRLVKSKGFADVVRAFAQVASEFPDWRLRIFGDGPEKTALLRIAQKSGVEGRVEFMGQSDDMLTEWSRASIGVLASRYEGLPLVIMEGRGAGLPFVAYDCLTGPAELISNGQDGYLVPVGDVSAFAGALRELMGNPDLLQSMGERGPSSMERFSPDTIASEWERLYSRLLACPSARAAAREVSNGGSTKSTDATAEGSGPVSAAHGLEKPALSVSVSEAELTVAASWERTRAALERQFASADFGACAVTSELGTTKWLVSDTHRSEALALLRAWDQVGLRVRLYSGATRVDTGGVVPADSEEFQGLLASVDGVSIDLLYSSPAVLSTIGTSASVNLEFWSSVDGSELLSGSRRNAEYDLLAPSQLAGKPFAVADTVGRAPLWDAVDGPIDAVYTWVDGSDSAWAERKRAFAGDNGGSDLASGDLRFRNRDELRYSLRSLYQNAPWIRNIYIVTDGQVPAWLEPNDRVRVVDHRELFPDLDVLPVFNSHAIETVLHRIPGLAEKFIYFNDDVFLMRSQRANQYFDSAGSAKFFPSPTKINELGELAEPHQAAGANNRTLLQAAYGKRITKAMLHTPHPHLKSHLDHIERRWSAEFEQTRQSKFRADTDISVASSLAQYSGYFERKYQPGSLAVSFVSLGSEGFERALLKLSPERLDVLTFGELHDDPRADETAEVASTYLRRTFPVKAPWERAVSPDESTLEG